MATILRGSDNFNSSDYINYPSIYASYYLLDGNLSVDTTVLTNGFGTTLYTGNGTTQSINTGIDMSTQWGNDVSETFGGLVWTKARSTTTGHALYDTVRGALNWIASESTIASSSLPNSLTSFNNNGFSVGSASVSNINANTFTSQSFQTTHRRTGVTSHGKAYTEHYNPFTGFTIIKYEGSGLEWHEIPHSLGRKLGFVTVKNLTSAIRWQSFTESQFMFLNEITAGTSPSNTTLLLNDNSSTLVSANNETNASTNQYIMYGWANSYYDEADKLIGNYEVGVYQGTGVAGNKVVTRGKPAWIMVKRLDAVGNWLQTDVLRSNFDEYILPNSNAAAGYAELYTVYNDGFALNQTTSDWNVSGGQYLYMVVYDNDSGSGKSKYPKATDTSNVQINNALIPLAHGIDNKGNKNSIVVANETITGVTYTDGKNYLYKTDTGYGVKPYEPRYLSSELIRRFAGEQPDYYDVESNKWFNTDSGSDLVSNGKFSSGVTTGWTAQDGAILSIDNGTLKVLNGTANSGSAYQLITGLTIGKRYKVKAKDVGGNTNYSSIYIAYGSPILANAIVLSSSGGTLPTLNADTEFIAQATSVYLVLRNEIVTINLYNNFDDISVFPTDIVPTTEITESRNYLNHIVNADQNGQVTYVEELPKIEYKDVIKANEYQGKNACTAWVNFDGTTTPPIIRDSYNVSAVIRTTTGEFDIYFKDPMDNLFWTIGGHSSDDAIAVSSIGWNNVVYPRTSLNKTHIQVFQVSNQVPVNRTYVSIHIYGGNN